MPIFLFLLLGFYFNRVFIVRSIVFSGAGSVFSWAMRPRAPMSGLCTRRFILDRILLLIIESTVRCVYHTHVIPGSACPVSMEVIPYVLLD